MLGEFVVRVANLVEAEGRAARRSAVDILAVGCCWLAATLLAVASLIAMVAAAYRGMVDGLNLSPGWAYLVCALALAALAGAAAWSAQALRRTGRLWT